jgi:hypothetical protein
MDLYRYIELEFRRIYTSKASLVQKQKGIKEGAAELIINREIIVEWLSGGVCLRSNPPRHLSRRLQFHLSKQNHGRGCELISLRREMRFVDRRVNFNDFSSQQLQASPLWSQGISLYAHSYPCPAHGSRQSTWESP